MAVGGGLVELALHWLETRDGEDSTYCQAFVPPIQMRWTSLFDVLMEMMASREAGLVGLRSATYLKRLCWPVPVRSQVAQEVALVVVPLLGLGGLELALRLAGYGYPTDFFLPARVNGREFYMPNLKFGYRFFPPALARVPLPLRMATDKSANSYRIFLLGESAAYGDPDPTYGVGRYLEVLLRERFPGTQFEVVGVAVTAINSHTILPMHLLPASK